MIKIELIDPSDTNPRELKALANFLLDLAGEKPASNEVHIKVTADTSDAQKAVKDLKDAATFNAHELAEAEQIRQANEAAAAERNPDPKAVFAHSTAAASPAPIAPVAKAATSTVPNVSLPPAPPAVPQVATAAPITASHAPGVELDSKGLPWDSRIHSGSHEKVRDGSWKKRRGVDDASVAQVEAELRGVPSVAQPAPAPLPAINPPTAAPSVPVFTPPPATAPIAPPANAMTFPLLMPKITAALGAGSLSQQRIQEVLAANGLQSIPMLATRPDLVPAIDAALFGA